MKSFNTMFRFAMMDFGFCTYVDFSCDECPCPHCYEVQPSDFFRMAKLATSNNYSESQSHYLYHLYAIIDRMEIK